MNPLLMNLLTAAAVSAIVSAAVSLWLRGPARRHSGSKSSSHDNAGARRPAPRRAWDDGLEDEWFNVQKRALSMGSAIITGAIDELNAYRALIEERPAARVETHRPRLAQPPSAAPAGPPRDDSAKALARMLYRDWCTQGRRPEPSEEMNVVPMRHEVLRAEGATGQPGQRFHDAQQVDAFVRFSAREDTGWMFPHPDARHVPEYVRFVFPTLTDNQLASRPSLASTEPVAIVRRRDHWELR